MGELAAFNKVELSKIGAINGVNINSIAAINHVNVPALASYSSYIELWDNYGTGANDHIVGILYIKNSSGSTLQSENIGTQSQYYDTTFNAISAAYYVDISGINVQRDGFGVTTDRRWRLSSNPTWTTGNYIPSISSTYSENTSIVVELKSATESWPK